MSSSTNTTGPATIKARPVRLMASKPFLPMRLSDPSGSEFNTTNQTHFVRSHPFAPDTRANPAVGRSTQLDLREKNRAPENSSPSSTGRMRRVIDLVDPIANDSCVLRELTEAIRDSLSDNASSSRRFESGVNCAATNLPVASQSHQLCARRTAILKQDLDLFDRHAEVEVDLGCLAQLVDGDPFVLGVSLGDVAGAEDDGGDVGLGDA